MRTGNGSCVLRVAAGEGRLTTDELGERLEAALSSRTLDEPAMLTADLVAGPGESGVATTQAKDVIRIDQRGGSVRRTGRWLVPRRLELRPPEADRVAQVADQVQEWVIEELWGQAATNWPRCPDHRDSHPLRASTRDRSAVWVCPAGGTPFSPVGSLR